MDIEKLLATKDDLIWDDEEPKVSYSYPLPTNDPDQMRENAVRLSQIPPAERAIYEIGPFLLAESPESHIGPFKHALDFLVDIGTKIVAAESGIIIEVQEQCEQWGDGPEFRDYLNYLTLQHDNAEFSQYCHLEKGSVRKLGLRIGTRVNRGDFIGTTGMSGWMDRPHLHFIIFRHDTNPQNPFGFKSLKVRFED